MGPITLFDKSFLQSLDINEAVWFDNFYLTNIPPIFYVETLADLDKKVKDRTPEQEVAVIASKTPEMNSAPNTFHQSMVIANLMGHSIPMNGRIVLNGGRCIETIDRKAVFFDLPPERQAFERWQNGDFLDVERLFAKKWRAILKLAESELFDPMFNSSGVIPKCHSLEEAKLVSESIMKTENQKELIILIFELLYIPEKFIPEVCKRWQSKKCPPLLEFAPYAAYILTIEIFFFIVIKSELIQRKINSKTDFAYLFYLPFCMVFVSSDKLHRRCAPLFLRKDQEFIWGPDLKADLNKIDLFFDKLPDEEKEKGIYSIASYPPEDDNLITIHLWDRFLPKWRTNKKNRPAQTNFESTKKLIEEVEKISKSNNVVNFDSESADALILTKNVRKKKGKWWQLPKNLNKK